MNLRDRAKEAYYEARDRVLEAQKEDLKNALSLIGIETEGVANQDASITIEGITFRLDPDTPRTGGLVIEGVCTKCGCWTISHRISDLASLGRIIDSFEPSYSHQCSTWEGRLMRLLDERYGHEVE